MDDPEDSPLRTFDDYFMDKYMWMGPQIDLRVLMLGGTNENIDEDAESSPDIPVRQWRLVEKTNEWQEIEAKTSPDDLITPSTHQADETEAKLDKDPESIRTATDSTVWLSFGKYKSGRQFDRATGRKDDAGEAVQMWLRL